MAQLAVRESLRLTRGLARSRQEGHDRPTNALYDDALERSDLLRLDRRATREARRRDIPEAVHTLETPGVLGRKGMSPSPSGCLPPAECIDQAKTKSEKAKADGRWKTAYAGQAKVEVPDDLETALTANPRARAMFETLTSANRYAILYRIGNAKKAETRARRIEQFVEMLARGETIHPQGPDHLGDEPRAR